MNALLPPPRCLCVVAGGMVASKMSAAVPHVLYSTTTHSAASRGVVQVVAAMAASSALIGHDACAMCIFVASIFQTTPNGGGPMSLSLQCGPLRTADGCFSGVVYAQQQRRCWWRDANRQSRCGRCRREERVSEIGEWNGKSLRSNRRQKMFEREPELAELGCSVSSQELL